METNTLFEKRSDSITIGEVDISDVESNFYRYFATNSIYLQNKYNMALEDYFISLKNLWLEETKYSSNLFYSTKHPAYLRIIQLGNDIIPFLLKDMSIFNTHWFIALNQITGANPIKESHIGNIQEMTNDWVIWGKEMNYL